MKPRLTLAALSISVLFGCAKSDVPTYTAEIKAYYLPFDMETFVPVTVDSIEAAAVCVFRFPRTSQEGERLSAWFEQRSLGLFGAGAVRLKIVGLEDKPVYVDKVGGRLKGGFTFGPLGSREFDVMKRFFEEASVAANCDPIDRR